MIWILALLAIAVLLFVAAIGPVLTVGFHHSPPGAAVIWPFLSVLLMAVLVVGIIRLGLGSHP